MNLSKAGDRASVFSLIFANLLPLAGVFFFDWDAFAVVLLYWAENLVIGGYTVLKMILLPVGDRSRHLEKFIMIPFFCVHYGGFCAGHGVFIAAIFSDFGGGGFRGSPSSLFFGTLPSMVWPVLALIVSHGISFVQNYLLQKESEGMQLGSLMFAPYRRIFVLHIAIVAAGFFVMILDSSIPLLVILIGLKIGLDIWLHNREHVRLKNR